MCEKMSVYAGEKRDQVNILRLCCGCGVCGVFACCGCGVCGVFAAVLPRQYLHPDAQRLVTGRSGLVLWVGSAHSEMSGHFRSQSTHHYYTRKQDTLGSGRQVGISHPHTAYTWGRCKKTTPDRGLP